MKLADIPGFSEAFAEAVAKDAEDRDFVWLNLPKTLCGVQVMLMTLRQFLRLILLENPIVCAPVPDVEDEFLPPESIAQFLWILSPHYLEPFEPGISMAAARVRVEEAARRRKEFVESIADIPIGEIQPAIAGYVDFIFADAPCGQSSGAAPITSFAAVYIDMVRSECGGSADEVLDAPLPCIYQQVCRIIRRNNPAAAFFNKRPDRVKRQFAQRANGNKR